MRDKHSQNILWKPHLVVQWLGLFYCILKAPIRISTWKPAALTEVLVGLRLDMYILCV
jgi:hypothetical protein